MISGSADTDIETVVGQDLSLRSVVRETIDSKEKWKAIETFCEKVLTKKEMPEREREMAAKQDGALRGEPKRECERRTNKGWMNPEP